MKTNIDDISVGDLIYSKRSGRFASVVYKSWIGFRLQWSKSRFEGDNLTSFYGWDEWDRESQNQFLIFDTEKEKFEAILRYSS